MWALVAFFVAAVIGLAAVLAVCRGGSAPSKNYPWILADTAKAPTDGPANISPVAHGACSSTAMNGNSAFG